MREAREMCSMFSNVSVRKSHIFRYDIDSYKQGKYVVSDEWKEVSKCEIEDLEDEMGWHTLIKGVKNKEI